MRILLTEASGFLGRHTLPVLARQYGADNVVGGVGARDCDRRAAAVISLGGKLCGAGSGGFLLMLVPPAQQPGFRDRFRNTAVVPVGLDTGGSTIING